MDGCLLTFFPQERAEAVFEIDADGELLSVYCNGLRSWRRELIDELNALCIVRGSRVLLEVIVMKRKKKSPVILLLDTVWENCNSSTDHSWGRLNHSMRDALTLAIGAGFTFDIGDVRHVLDNYRSGYWIGDSDEWIYTLAIQIGNSTAQQSYEAAKNRTPIIADDVDPGRRHHGYLHSMGQRTKERLAVGFDFTFRNLRLKVTSFSGDRVVACAYRRVPDGDYFKEKLSKRFKLSRDDIITDRAERKERSRLLAKLSAADDHEAILKALGVKSRDEFNELSVSKIRKVAGKFCSV